MSMGAIGSKIGSEMFESQRSKSHTPTVTTDDK